MTFKKILTAQQIRTADEFTIQNESIASIDLMERASIAFVNAIKSRLSLQSKILIVCGQGNNGGDGFAVGRLLTNLTYSVQCILIGNEENLSDDCKTNFKKIKSPIIINSESEIPDFTEYDIIIDAIFGTGLRSPIMGLHASVVNRINESNSFIISVDIPSGLYSDNLPDSDSIIKSDLCVSFQLPKKIFMLPESGTYINEWVVVNIGLNENFIENQSSSLFLIDESVKDLLKKRRRISHKGTFGHCLIIGGSHGKIGAIILAAKAGLRSGVGLLSVYTPDCGYQILQTTIPEAMCQTDKHNKRITKLPEISGYSSIGIGPGIGTHEATKNMLKELLIQSTIPLVIDADALNILASSPNLIDLIPKNSILTPHPKEFERLVAGKFNNSQERLEEQRAFSINHNCFVVLKDSHTSVSDPEGNIYFNISGCPALATAGSGDVLTGMITSFVGQGYSTLEAALLAVYIHGESGQKASSIKGESSVIASDIIDAIRFD